MSRAAELLKIEYIDIIKEKIQISNDLNSKINDAKKRFTKDYYRKKLHRNNNQCAHFLEKLDKLEKIMESTQQESAT